MVMVRGDGGGDAKRRRVGAEGGGCGSEGSGKDSPLFGACGQIRLLGEPAHPGQGLLRLDSPRRPQVGGVGGIDGCYGDKRRLLHNRQEPRQQGSDVAPAARWRSSSPRHGACGQMHLLGEPAHIGRGLPRQEPPQRPRGGGAGGRDEAGGGNQECQQTQWEPKQQRGGGTPAVWRSGSPHHGACGQMHLLGESARPGRRLSGLDSPQRPRGGGAGGHVIYQGNEHSDAGCVADVTMGGGAMGSKPVPSGSGSLSPVPGPAGGAPGSGSPRLRSPGRLRAESRSVEALLRAASGSAAAESTSASLRAASLRFRRIVSHRSSPTSIGPQGHGAPSATPTRRPVRGPHGEDQRRSWEGETPRADPTLRKRGPRRPPRIGRRGRLPNWQATLRREFLGYRFPCMHILDAGTRS